MGLENENRLQILPTRLLRVEQAYFNVYQAYHNGFIQLGGGNTVGAINQAFEIGIRKEFEIFLPQTRDALPGITGLYKRGGTVDVNIDANSFSVSRVVGRDTKSTYYLPGTNEVLKHDSGFYFYPKSLNPDPESPDFVGIDKAREIWERQESAILSFRPLEEWLSKGASLYDIAEAVNSIERYLTNGQRPLVTVLRQRWQSLEDQRVAQRAAAGQVHGQNNKRLTIEFIKELRQTLTLSRFLFDRKKFLVSHSIPIESEEHLYNSGLIKGDQMSWSAARDQAGVPPQDYYFTVAGYKLSAVPRVESKNLLGQTSQKPDFSKEKETDTTAWTYSDIFHQIVDHLLYSFLPEAQAKAISDRAYLKTRDS